MFLKKILLPVLFVIEAALLYGQLILWKEQWIGILLLVCFIGITGEWWRHLLQHVFGIKRNTWTATILAWFAAFSLLGLSVSICINWYRFTPLVLWGCFVATGFVSFVLYLSTKHHRIKERIDPDLRAHVFSQPVFSKRLIIPLLYLVLWLCGLVVLYQSSSNDVLLSPWQTISPYYILIFFILMLLLGIMVFSYYGSKVMLFFLVLHGLLLHIYLPLSHINPWGGDVWRHVSMERQIERGDVIRPVLFGSGVEWRDVRGFSIPEAFFHPQKYAYGHLWGTTLAVTETTRLDLIVVNKWLMPILWSLMMPFLLFSLGRQLFRSPRAAFFLVWLSFLPFPLQALGALALPVSLGLLLFLFTLHLFLSFVESRNKRQLGVIMLFALLMCFSYPLYSIVMWVLLLFGSMLAYMTKHVKIMTAGLLVLSLVLLPAVEMISGTSHLPMMWQWLEAGKRMIGEWSGWYLASQIRPHDILSGNSIFNHTPASAFVGSPFTSWRWHVPLLLVVLWIGIGYGVIRSWKERQVRSKVVLFLSAFVFGGYMIGWYVLEGDRLLIRRTDAVLAVVMLILFVMGVRYMKDISVMKHKRIAVLVCLIAFSWFAATTYASGPDMRVVSADEYTVANDIWNIEKDKQTHCVLADTWVLLALEAQSSGAIVGGGFPMEYQFAQPERVQWYQSLYQIPAKDLIVQAKVVTGAPSCTIVAEDLSTPETLTTLFGKKPETRGNFSFWQGVEK